METNKNKPFNSGYKVQGLRAKVYVDKSKIEDVDLWDSVINGKPVGRIVEKNEYKIWAIFWFVISIVLSIILISWRIKEISN